MGPLGFETLSSDNRPWLLVVHDYPDTDAWACLWAASKFIVPEGGDYTVHFVRSGEMIVPEETEGYNVLHMDTGLGDTDQHGKGLARASSFMLLIQKYGLDKDKGLTPIMELTRATDNVEPISPTSIHYYFKGLPYHFRNKGTRAIDWGEVYPRIFEVLSVIYAQECLRVRTLQEFSTDGKIEELSNGVRLAPILWHPYWRDTAFGMGADVVLWTQAHGKRHFDVGIQVGREANVPLTRVAAMLRKAEAERRGIEVPRDIRALATFGSDPMGSKWFFHDSGNLIVCGSRTHPLEGDEFTKLRPSEIVNLVKGALAMLK